uniref:Uncharacterized protein n=1 Tax=Glossina palpalis gambiensis TaxID=67801 RepID=A0A1B0C0I1_9MUSC
MKQKSLSILSRVLNANTPGTDGRGKMAGSSRKTNEEKIKVLGEHILSFPTCESHYRRSHHTSGRKYLSADLDIRKMYELYHPEVTELLTNNLAPDTPRVNTVCACHRNKRAAKFLQGQVE